MSIFKVNKSPSDKQLHEFGITMLIAFIVLATIITLLPLLGKATFSDVTTWQSTGRQIACVIMVTLGALIFVISRVSLPVTRLIYIGWMTVAVLIGMVMSPIMLSVLFFIVLPVFSLIRFSDPLRKKLKKDGTYWEKAKPHEPTLYRMQRPF